MFSQIASVTLVVPDYDAGIAFYCDLLDFDLVENTQLSLDKRWVRVRPRGGGTALLLGKASDDRQAAAIGSQTGGRVAFILETDDFARDYANMTERGVRFMEEPRAEPYGKVAVFADPFGNLWDLIGPNPQRPSAQPG